MLNQKRMDKLTKLNRIHNQIRACKACEQMCGTPVHGPALESSILLVGQAPGVHEAGRGRPFAHTAGKSLFSWFHEHTQVSESEFRDHVYIASVARCFPGKSASGKGDREPGPLEILNCRRHLEKEVAILNPKLVIAVGKVAIKEVLGPEIFLKQMGLSDVVGKTLKARFHGTDVDVICLPHPSGISVWPRIEPGKSLLKKSLQAIKTHPAWKEVFQTFSVG